MIFGAVLLVGAVQLTLADREHKVHNIVLYPERHSWCQTTPIKQVVASPGFEPVTIDNNVCVGACYSYSIPRTQPAEPGELIGPYCDSCQPVGTRCYHVTLHADGRNADGPKTLQKRVEIITNCSCMSCDAVQSKGCELADRNTSELPLDLFSVLKPPAPKPTPDEIPDLLHVAAAKNISESSFGLHSLKPSREQTFELDAKLVDLLRSIQNDEEEAGSSYDREQLQELLEMIEGSEHELNDKNLLEFINFVNIHNSEDLELDLGKLKEALLSFKKLDSNEQINKDAEAFAKATHLKNFGVEGGHAYGLKGGHVAMGLQPNALPAGEAKHHHVGEPQHVGLDLGHLVRGPHGSLAFQPDDVEEKLDLEHDMIKPNQEGLVLSYENRPKAAD